MLTSRTDSEPTARISTVVALALVIAYGGLGAWVIVTLGPYLPRYGEFAPVLLPTSLAYPFVVASLSRRSGSSAVIAIGALIPACAAALVGVRVPYTWRDVAVPVVIGIVSIVAIWMAEEVLGHIRARHFGRLAILVVLVLTVLAAIVAFIGVLILMTGTTSAPF